MLLFEATPLKLCILKMVPPIEANAQQSLAHHRKPFCISSEADMKIIKFTTAKQCTVACIRQTNVSSNHRFLVMLKFEP